MDYIYQYLQKLGYNVNKDYYTEIENWISIWKGKQDWLEVKTIDNKTYPMYSLNLAKRSCEDLASTITSEPFTIKAKKNDEILQKDLKEAKVLERLAENIEVMGYTGTVATVTRIINANVIGEDEEARLVRGDKTKIKTIEVKANQIIPLTIENGEIVNCAFVSEQTIMIEDKNIKVDYLELHELKEKGYQVTNKYFRQDNGKEVIVEGIVETYNTLSNTPLFSINKLPKVNNKDGNNGLGIALFGNAIDQLKLLDITYNNFGMDFKLGQKIMLVNKKLTQVTTEPYRDKDGVVKERQKVIYPTDIKKQLFTDISGGIMGNANETPYIYEYNPDLRVGDNKEGIQFVLDTFAFEIGYGTKYYSFENGAITTATETIISRKDFVDNMIKIRRRTNEYLKGICKSILLCEKMLGNASIDETQEIEIAEVDGFLQDDETIREKLFTDLGAGVISKKRYLMKVYNLTEKEAEEELTRIKQEEETEPIETTIEDEGE